jgi:acyl carrier protein
MQMGDIVARPDMAKFLAEFVEAVDFQQAVPIAEDTELASLDEWDSLAALGVIVMCDTEYGVSITGNDLKVCTRVGDILAKVQAKKAA